MIAKVLWESTDGAYAVVFGLFPETCPRSMTAPTLAEAVARQINGITYRPATTKPAFAKVLRGSVTDSDTKWGEYGP